MTKEMMIEKIVSLKELMRMQEELAAEIEAAKDEIKAGMDGQDVVIVGAFKVSNKEVTTTRLDTTALKKSFAPEALAPFMKTTTTRRFLIA